MSQTETMPKCPRCEGPMVLRTGSRGQFYGCSAYPACRGTLNLVDPETGPPYDISAQTESIKVAPTSGYEPMPLFVGSEEQNNIWEHMLHSPKHLVVKAFAGSGKSASMIQGCMRMPRVQRIVYVAFNRHNASEANGKLQASRCFHTKASTYHSLGLRICRASLPKAEVNDQKVSEILESLTPYPEPKGWFHTMALARRLTSFAKSYLLDPERSDFQDRLERIADHHGVDLNSVGKRAMELVPQVLQICKDTAKAMLDFDDMIWIPYVMDLPMMDPVDTLIVDEVQDIGAGQQDLAFRACPNGRIIAVGDEFQSIYQWRGASSNSINELIERLGKTVEGVETLPLTVTRRCPQSHVRLAQALVPGIQAMDDAPEGEVLSMAHDKAVAAMQAGDLVLCRVNAGLVPVAYDLIRRGVKPVIRGRDIGKGLIDLINKLALVDANPDEPTIPDVVKALSIYRQEKLAKLIPLGDKAEGRIGALHEKCDCLFEFLSNSKTVEECRASIESVFADFEPDGQPKNAVVLGTIHRTKGLESERVFILSPELIPHPMARKDWEYQGEKNLAYVAVTRAKYDAKTGAAGTLIFCGPIPAIFATKESI